MCGLALLAVGTRSRAQVQPDFSVLRINEVVSDNETLGPTTSTGGRHDMVELFNTGNVELTLGSTVFRERLALSDTEAEPILGLWTFPPGTTIPPRGFLVVFFQPDPASCDIHTTFGISREGTEPLTLWGPVGEDGKRDVIDQVWLPPLDEDVSFGRYPDGAGPAPVSFPTPSNPTDDTFLYFFFYQPDKTSFGTCTGSCGSFDRVCTGAPNKPPTENNNLRPEPDRSAHSTNHPAAAEAVTLTARVEDDKEPTPPNISRVYIRYRINGATEFSEENMVFDSIAGVQNGADRGRPNDRWTLWKGTIPGQPAGTLVEFSLHAEDREGGRGAAPDVEDLCQPSIVGPCNEVGMPGPGCVPEPPPSLRYDACDVLQRYIVGYEPEESLKGLIINEVVADQLSVLKDETDGMFDDFIEILNTGSQPADLRGLWLSDKAFQPKAWQFPQPTDPILLAPGERLLVWTDGDGGLCPRPDEKIPGDGQDCPDPTSVEQRDFHTDFQLEGSGEQVYLWDREDKKFGLLSGVEFERQDVNGSWSLIPDGDRTGNYQKAEPTPLEPNKATGEPQFLRGNSTSGDCSVDLSDAVYTLNHLFVGGPPINCPDAADADDNGAINVTDPIFLLRHLFQGGPPPPLPGITTPGPDPTVDDLALCVEPEC
jgi:hypothetical protein